MTVRRPLVRVAGRTQQLPAGDALVGAIGRNRIINGDCLIAQRPQLVAIYTVNGYGGPDRFNCSNGYGGQFIQSLGSMVYNGVTKNAVVQTVVASISGFPNNSNMWSGIGQYIEGNNVFDLLGQPVTISFLFNTNVSGTYSVALSDATPSKSIVFSFVAVANTPMYVSFTTTLPSTLAITASNALGLRVRIGALNQTNLATATTNAWISGNYQAVTGEVNWGLAAGNFIAVTELQLEEGAIANPYAWVNAATSLAQCQRYYEAGSFFHVAYVGASCNIGSQVAFETMKRAAATITQTNLSVAGTASATPQNASSGYQANGFLSFRAATAGSCQFNETWTASAEL